MFNSEALTVRVLNIDIRVRVSGEAENMVTELVQPVHLPKGSVMWITGLSIPLVWPNIYGGNNLLHLTEKSDSLTLTSEVPIAIPETDYSNSTFTAALQTALTYLTSHTSILPVSVSYAATVASGIITIKTQWNGNDDRYDYTGHWFWDDGFAIHQKTLVRDWISYTDATLKEYVMSPIYQWSGLSCTIAYNGLQFSDASIDSHAGIYTSSIAWLPGGGGGGG
jgi:hypothetical protein